LYLETQQEILARFVAAVEEVFGLKIPAPVPDFPPTLEMGDLSITACFELAKQLRQPPRKIAEQVAARLMPLAGVERISIAGGGYINFYFERAKLAEGLSRLRTTPPEPALSDKGKILVEHTSINPNKAAHIGHLRNAVLGDTFVRLLRFRGNPVEIQNYIDNTGVQVADVVVGFVHLGRKSLEDVRRLIRDPAVRFDYYCWDLYARVFQYYAENKDSLALRAEALKAIEEGHGEMAAMADLASTAIVRKHLDTMERINVRYDLLVEESEILRLEFWKYAFEVLKETNGVRYEESGKNAGCWVMSLAEGSEGETTDEESGSEDIKIIVRSNGTVTYVGKDIAYHLWKFALLGKEFGYQLFHRYADGQPVWRTALDAAADAPAFGRGAVAYSVIDTRQSYLQNIVAAAFRALGFHEQAANLHHFAYEVVGLSPRCAEEMGLALSADDRQRSYIEVSGRKGLGIKADDLIDTLVEKATQEVQARQMTEDPVEQAAYARMIAVGALRYFLLKFSRRVIIAFDFKEALAFEGETGPYLQYSVVRARNIFRKFQESHPQFNPRRLGELVSEDQLQVFLSGNDGDAFWGLILLAAQSEMIADQAISGAEPAVVAKYAFRLAQAFNNFYHRYHILSEPDPDRQRFLLLLVHLVNESLSQTLELLGIEIPERM
jgi:arginyl-tRNA synthetase